MSVFKKIKAEIKNAESLIKALQDLGMTPEIGQDLKSNDVDLVTHWRGWGGENQKVAIAVNRDEVKKKYPGAMDGIGFQWNGTEYEVIADHYDTDYNSSSLVNNVKQRYTVNEASRIAALQGYMLQENILADGSIQLTCTSMGY